MPGINLLVYKDPCIREITSSGADFIYEDNFVSISKSIPYTHYPVQSWETEAFVFVIEGFFFEWSDYREKIETLAERYFTTSTKPDLLKMLFQDIDAEFIVVIHNKIQRSTIVFNDILGRFPYYMSSSEKYFILSRNVSFIDLFHGLTPNPAAFLESLSFGFSLGAKTLYKEIERLPGGTMIMFKGGDFTKNRYHEFNYELMINGDAEGKYGIQEIKSLFVESVRNRSRFADLNIVGLSGGLDSRVVAAGFKLSGLPCHLISYSDNEGNALKDIKYARQIADGLNMPLKIVDLPDPDLSDFEEYFSIKYGLNALDMTFLLNFYRHLTTLSERPAFFTGDGGDKIFPDLSPPSFVRSTAAMVDYAIRSNAKMNPCAAARILRQDNSALREEVFSLIQSYPERDWKYKYVHFIMDNRVANWLVEGEDRSRCFLTSFSPFYGVRLFRKLMSVPLHQKKSFALYDRFLKEISPETYDVSNANWGFNTSGKRRIQWTYFKEDLKKTTIGAIIKRTAQKKENYIGKLTSEENILFKKLLLHPAAVRHFDIRYAKGLKYFNSDNFLNMITLFKAASVQNL